MAACRGSSSKWFFTREQLETTPSRRCGLEPDRELSYRQQAANLIQDMGQRLNVSQLTINTAIVYMHRFYMNHSFTKFHRNIISPTTLFLAAKVEEQPRKLEHVIKVAHACLNPQEAPLDTKSNAYLQQAQELVILETIVLQTLGFEISIDHPHTDVVKCSQLVRGDVPTTTAHKVDKLTNTDIDLASKDLAQTSYYMATNSLHLTTFCLQYKPTVIACVCIHLACKWSNWEIPVSTDGKHWWEYVDNYVTLELLDELTHEFLQILEKTPGKLKRIRNWRATQAAKKPKSDDNQSADNSMLLDNSLGDSFTDPAFSKAASSFPVPLPGHSGSGPLSLGSMAVPYSLTGPSDWPQGHTAYLPSSSSSLKQDALSLAAHQGAAAPSSLQTSSSSLQHPAHRTEKLGDFNPVKHEHKGGGKQQQQQQQQSVYPPPPQPLPPPPPPAQKLSLDKYREKHTAELAAAGQKRRQEQQQGGGLESDGRGDSSTFSSYVPSSGQSDHRKHSQPHHLSQHALVGGSSTASPLKMKLPSSSSSGQDGPHQGDKRDKGAGSLKLRLPVPMPGGGSQLDKSGQASKEELKMKIRVSSLERHSSSDEGGANNNNNNNNKSKHSSPLVSKEKQHRGGEVSLHRPNKHGHGHSHPHVHSGNGRGGPEGLGPGSGLLRSPLGLVGVDGMAFAPPAPTSSSSSSRKRTYPESSHNHHSSSSSKVSKSSKSGAGAAGAGGLRTSQQYPPSDSSHDVGEQRH